MKNLFILIFLCGLCSCKFDSAEKPFNPRSVNAEKEIFNWTIIPGEKVGLIEKDFTEADIIGRYGRENVVRKEIGIGEGEMATATVLFPGTANELTILWQPNQKFTKLERFIIENEKSPWTTSQGVAVGTSLDKLEEINGGPFQFAGFEWDNSGYANDWQDGRIPDNVIVFLEPSNPKLVYPDLLGDGLFSSENEKAKAAGLYVRAVEILVD